MWRLRMDASEMNVYWLNALQEKDIFTVSENEVTVIISSFYFPNI